MLKFLLGVVAGVAVTKVDPVNLARRLPYPAARKLVEVIDLVTDRLNDVSDFLSKENNR